MIVTVPEASSAPVTLPDPSTVALPLLAHHAPPVVTSLKVIVVPAQIPLAPVIIAGLLFTVIVVVALHDVPVAYTTVMVPAVIPLTTPPALIEPAGPLLLHVPPAVAFDRLIVIPSHTLVAPRIEPGNAFTVTTAVVVQPDNV